MRTTIFTAGAGAAAVAAALALAGPAQAAEGDAQLSVLHGVPGLTVDVWVNGDRTLDDFAPGTSPPTPASAYAGARPTPEAARRPSPEEGGDLPGRSRAEAWRISMISLTASSLQLQTQPSQGDQAVPGRHGPIRCPDRRRR